jgi:SAM-dependent methyltransferase
MAISVRASAHKLRERARYMRPGYRLDAIAEKLAGATALEPGGPSSLFGGGGLVPVYPQLAALDVLDYAERTLWSAQAAPAGVNLRSRVVAEGGDLAQIPDDSYDAVLASHVLEHLANPLGALAEWRRVVRPGGHILLIVPHREGTFDHRRPVTTLEHLRADAERETGEDDLTHLEEILRLHDLERDPGAGSRENFERRCRDNGAMRAMHHHVFVSRTVVDVCRAAKLEVLALAPRWPFHIVCLCAVGEHPSNAALDSLQLSGVLRNSAFREDRQNTAAE